MSDPYLPDGCTGEMIDAWYESIGPEPEPELDPEPCCECGKFVDCDELLKGESADCLCYRAVYEPNAKLCGPCRRRSEQR